MLVQRYRSNLRNNDSGSAPDLIKPSTELFSVRNGCTKRDDLYILRKMENHFFPNSASESIGKIVNFVHDNKSEAYQ